MHLSPSFGGLTQLSIVDLAPHLEQHGSIGRNGNCISAVLSCDFAALPQIAEFCVLVEAYVLKFEGDGRGGIRAIEKADCQCAVRERFGPYFRWADSGDAVTLFAERVLVDGDNFLISEEGES